MIGDLENNRTGKLMVLTKGRNDTEIKLESVLKSMLIPDGALFHLQLYARGRYRGVNL